METGFLNWLECRSSKEACEEVIGLGRYGKVLTVPGRRGPYLAGL
jgi:hypothetical protein